MKNEKVYLNKVTLKKKEHIEMFVYQIKSIKKLIWKKIAFRWNWKDDRKMIYRRVWRRKRDWFDGLWRG